GCDNLGIRQFQLSGDGQRAGPRADINNLHTLVSTRNFLEDIDHGFGLRSRLQYPSVYQELTTIKFSLAAYIGQGDMLGTLVQLFVQFGTRLIGNNGIQVSHQPATVALQY